MGNASAKTAREKRVSCVVAPQQPESTGVHKPKRRSHSISALIRHHPSPAPSRLNPDILAPPPQLTTAPDGNHAHTNPATNSDSNQQSASFVPSPSSVSAGSSASVSSSPALSPNINTTNNTTHTSNSSSSSITSHRRSPSASVHLGAQTKKVVGGIALKHKTIKILLLGTHGSGKSVLARHTRLVVGGKFGFDASERLEFVNPIHKTVKRTVEALVTRAEEMALFDSDAAQFEASGVMLRLKHSDLQPRIGTQLARLWSTPPLRTVWHTRHNTHPQNNTNDTNDTNNTNTNDDDDDDDERIVIPAAAKHFMDNCERISSPGYVPSNEDLLHVDVATSTTVDILLDYAGKKLHLVDIPPQRFESQQLEAFFDAASVVLFVCAIDEYDIDVVFGRSRKLKRKKILESLKLFRSFANHPAFELVPHKFLIFNKKDEFDEKIKLIDLKVCFPDYTGGLDSDNAIAFLKTKFLAVVPESGRNTHVIAVSALDSSDIKALLKVVTAPPQPDSNCQPRDFMIF